MQKVIKIVICFLSLFALINRESRNVIAETDSNEITLTVYKEYEGDEPDQKLVYSYVLEKVQAAGTNLMEDEDHELQQHNPSSEIITITHEGSASFAPIDPKDLGVGIHQYTICEHVADEEGFEHEDQYYVVNITVNEDYAGTVTIHKNNERAKSARVLFRSRYEETPASTPTPTPVTETPSSQKTTPAPAPAETPSPDIWEMVTTGAKARIEYLKEDVETNGKHYTNFTVITGAIIIAAGIYMKRKKLDGK